MQNCSNSRAVTKSLGLICMASKLGSWPSVESKKGNRNNQYEFLDLTESLVRILQGHQIRYPRLRRGYASLRSYHGYNGQWCKTQ